MVTAMAGGLLLGSQGGSLAAPTASAAELAAVSVARHSAYEPADSAGVPLKPCGPANDGERVETLDANGAKGIFFCKFYDPIFGDPYWQWTEVVW